MLLLPAFMDYTLHRLAIISCRTGKADMSGEQFKETHRVR